VLFDAGTSSDGAVENIAASTSTRAVGRPSFLLDGSVLVTGEVRAGFPLQDGPD
jgi:hypothetical protein